MLKLALHPQFAYCLPTTTTSCARASSELRGDMSNPSRRVKRKLMLSACAVVLGGSAASIWRAMAARGYHWAAVAISEPMIQLARALGFDVKVLGAPRPYWGEARVPALLASPDPRAWR